MRLLDLSPLCPDIGGSGIQLKWSLGPDAEKSEPILAFCETDMLVYLTLRLSSDFGVVGSVIRFDKRVETAGNQPANSELGVITCFFRVIFKQLLDCY